ncbi:MAG: hypothetical protein HZB56_14480 [Deltaproteobacteria bacterium]|nr:hypothetical protein [Deltaproteobacteria bacterium]
MDTTIRTFATLLLLLLAGQAVAEDFLDPVATRACACLTGAMAAKQESREAQTARAGLCILNAFGPADRAALLKEHGIDLSDPVKNGQRAGQVVGARMGTYCPDAVVALANNVNAPRVAVLAGEVVKVEEEGFVVLTVKDEAGKVTRLHWLQTVTSNRDLPTTYRTLAGSRVEVTFESVELFDPKIGEYRAFRVLKGVTVR